MDKICILLLLTFVLAESFANPRGLMFNLNNGELCLQSAQCKSKCCHKTSGFTLARCADKAAENQECSPKHLITVYYKCPCERGLICDVDKNMNSDFGSCKDPSNIIKHP